MAFSLSSSTSASRQRRRWLPLAVAEACSSLPAHRAGEWDKVPSTVASFSPCPCSLSSILPSLPPWPHLGLVVVSSPPSTPLASETVISCTSTPSSSTTSHVTREASNHRRAVVFHLWSPRSPPLISPSSSRLQARSRRPSNPREP